MRNRGKALGWGIALAAVAAVVTAGTVYAGTGSSAPESAIKTTLSMEQMRSVLVPLAEQPETRFVRGPMTLKQAAAENAFVAPPTMIFKPQSCATYLSDVLGGLDTRDGWIQFGSRVHKDHNDNFIQAVVTIPGGADLNKIREAAATCTTGTLTLEGQVSKGRAVRAVGDITYTERSAPVIEGAKTLALTGRTVFHEQAGSDGLELVKQYEMPPDAQLLVDGDQECVANSTIATAGDTLVLVVESDVDLSNDLTAAMFNNVRKA